MKALLFPAMVVVGCSLAGCHQAGPGADSARPSATVPGGSPGARDQATTGQDAGEPGVKHRRLISRDRPKWPDPWPQGCVRLISVAADVLPNGKVESAWVTKSSCAAVDDLAIAWLKGAEFEPDPAAKGSETQTIVLSWSFDAP